MSDAIGGLGPAAAVLALVWAPVVIVYFVLRHRRDVTAMKLKAAANFVESGAPVPFDLLLEKPKASGYGDLRLGMVLTCIGVGAVLFSFTLKEHRLWGLGLLPFFAGLGYLITWTLSHHAAVPGKNE